ncbi:helix-turn-helix transcriptional regulator [Sphaerotilus sp.]|uniref:helix-turn-helix transcriptional regulator n=1 Tax=Sphaerotilus sp. TaxID=2093942 RepID=UPI0034E2A0D7
MLTIASIQNREHFDRPRADPCAPPQVHSAQWLLHMLTGALDELDYGLLILDAAGHLMQANQMGRQHCTALHGSCRLQGSQLHARTSVDEPVLLRALAQAAAGRRSLLKLGEGPHVETVAVVPLGSPLGDHADGAILLVFGKQQVCEALSVEHFARVHNLTHAEGMVLTALCSGDDPGAIARRFGVAVSTVRTQIASVRQKTQAASIRDLVRQVAMLPPIVSILGHEAAH